MKTRHLRHSLCALLLCGMAFANQTNAAVIYDWEGTCTTGCVTATAQLTLTQAGAFTSPPDNAVYVDFTAQFDGVSVIGPGELEFPDFITFDPTADTINIGTFTLGFSVTDTMWSFSRPGGFSASGTDSMFSLRLVPEPPALALLLVGMFACLICRRRMASIQEY